MRAPGSRPEGGLLMGELVLVLGGVKSGKSKLAKELACERQPVTYVATATVDPNDPEMVARVARHRAERPRDWRVVEVPRDFAKALPELVAAEGSVVIDCATLWI